MGAEARARARRVRRRASRRRRPRFARGVARRGLRDWRRVLAFRGRRHRRRTSRRLVQPRRIRELVLGRVPLAAQRGELRGPRGELSVPRVSRGRPEQVREARHPSQRERELGRGPLRVRFLRRRRAPPEDTPGHLALERALHAQERHEGPQARRPRPRAPERHAALRARQGGGPERRARVRGHGAGAQAARGRGRREARVPGWRRRHRRRLGVHLAGVGDARGARGRRRQGEAAVRRRARRGQDARRGVARLGRAGEEAGQLPARARPAREGVAPRAGVQGEPVPVPGARRHGGGARARAGGARALPRGHAHGSWRAQRRAVAGVGHAGDARAGRGRAGAQAVPEEPRRGPGEQVRVPVVGDVRSSVRVRRSRALAAAQGV